jgi:hypothetical protein
MQVNCEECGILHEGVAERLQEGQRYICTNCQTWNVVLPKRKPTTVAESFAKVIPGELSLQGDYVPRSAYRLVCAERDKLKEKLDECSKAPHGSCQACEASAHLMQIKGEWLCQTCIADSFEGAALGRDDFARKAIALEAERNELKGALRKAVAIANGSDALHQRACESAQTANAFWKGRVSEIIRAAEAYMHTRARGLALDVEKVERELRRAMRAVVHEGSERK